MLTIHRFGFWPIALLWAGIATFSVSAQTSPGSAVYLDQLIGVREGQNLGSSAAINPAQTHMVIGSPNEHTMGFLSGAAYLFEHVNGSWTEVMRLLPPTQNMQGSNGFKVAINDQWLVISRPNFAEPGNGQVFIHDLSGQLLYTLSEPSATNGFGGELAMHGNSIWVADALASSTSPGGLVWRYDFQPNTQSWLATSISNPMPQFGARFGLNIKVSPNGEQLLISADSQDLPGINNAGVVHHYQKSGNQWNLVNTLQATVPQVSGHFGYTAALGDELMAMSHGLITNQDFTDDAIVVFEENPNGQWVQTQTFVDNELDERIGHAIAVNQTQLVFTKQQGTADLHQRHGFDDWFHQETIDPNDFETGLSNGFGQGGLHFTADALAVNYVGKGLALLKQQQTVRAASGNDCAGANPVLCEWVLEDWVNGDHIQDSSVGDQFGVSVDIDGDWAVIGVFADDDQGQDAGAVYVYQKTAALFQVPQWFPKVKLVASDGDAGDQFGRSVAIHNQRIVVGAYLDDVPGEGTDAGSVYVFENLNGQWTETQKLTSGEGLAGAGDRFGFALDLDGNSMMVGAYRDDENGLDAGAVYAHQWTGTEYQFIEKIIANDGQPGDGFGYALSLSGNQALIGAYLADDITIDAGAAYVYEWFVPPIGAWIETDKLLPYGVFVNQGDVFGAAVSLEQNMAVIGAPKHEDAPFADDDRGAVFVYRQDAMGDWLPLQKIFPTEQPAGAQFGRSLDLSENGLLVGAWLQDVLTSSAQILAEAGSAHHYRWDQTGGVLAMGAWELSASLQAQFPGFQDAFGHAVALAGDQLLVGEYRADILAEDNRGRVWVFVDDLIFAHSF
ncbi:FG-GAP repeat protein [Marinicella meishanensis]|uniref:FG-GAP repeat protein n=1 Tax=Marinicella meishanensis TaxID=2873263 RepID=UPI001CBE35C2|nr:FG-GAP repeat protein [Marinicella sp. NBU2979]